MKKITIIILLAITATIINAQETLIDVGNPLLKAYSKTITTKDQATTDTLDLPFFDDFSASYIYPDTTKWLDKFAYINNDFAIDPISINVASLDALNPYGSVYPHLPSMSSDVADFLTSAPINLDVNVSDSAYLSFYYQAGGNGNKPEEKDSLVLEFKSPETDWQSVWKIEGGERMEEFKKVLIPIIDTLYLVKGFQFRFKNYASLSSNYEPSWVSNADFWNIDYVKLDTARSFNDTLAEDIAFIKNFKSPLKDYTTVPWKHFKNYTDDIIKDTLTFLYKNSYNETSNVKRQVEIVDMYGSTPLYALYEDSENALALSTVSYDKKIAYDFNSDAEDSAKFMIKGFISIEATDVNYRYRWNDTIRYYQEFDNYYAYDDGTAEKGYGISGQGTAFSSLAIGFTPLKPDTLKGVYIYFNQVLNEANRKYFFLTVWKDNNGQPGDTLFQKIGVKPNYSDEINKFLYYSLDTSIYIDDKFYIGWVKTTDDMLNCGYDINNDASSNMFYNVSGTWQPHSYQGTMMIRPVMGENIHEEQLFFKPQIANNIDFKIYPNPASDYLNISCEDYLSEIIIYDTSGRIVKEVGASTKIFIGDLKTGTYFICPQSKFTKLKTQKLLIIR